MNTDRDPTATTYLGLFFVALATVMYEIVLTRIFSVTMWYHFAFVAISIAMFGMTVGAIIVYLRPAFFTRERVTEHLALSAVLFAVSAVVSFLISLFVPFDGDMTVSGVASTGVTYAIIAVPFVFSGVCVALALTKFPRRVGKLYAADLIGAATGCLWVIVTLNVTDGPTAVIVVGSLAGIGAVLFGARARPRLKQVTVTVALVLAAFAAVHTVLVREQSPLIRLQWVKGRAEPRPLYEKWNSFSRLTVYGDATRASAPAGWGLSAAFRPERGVRQLSLFMDASAGTVLTGYDGNPADLEHLKYDVTNLVHYVRRGARVLVIGVGGGRDLLSAILFGQRSVLGVEINQDIIATVNGKFGGFTGHLDRLPQVRFVNDEARSYIARQQERFDIIQISLIDTWAATAAGAFVLTENSLYTAEAWKLFLDRLSPNGVLAVSRYHFRSRPDETYRLTSLAHTALTQSGVTDPRGQIVIVKQMDPNAPMPVGIATILVGRAPFSDLDLDAIEAVTRRMQFEVVLSPRFSADATFTTLASAGDPSAFLAAFPVNIAAPTDDSPFFFHTLRLRNVFNRAGSGQDFDHINMKAVSVLGVLLIVVTVLTGLCIVVPLAMTTERADLRGSVPLMVFFAGIGLGFMFVEISQMQRLIVFLGHPTYSLSVVLFSLLVSSGVGSYLTGRVEVRGATGPAARLLLLLLAVLFVFGIVSPGVIRAYQESTTPVRVLLVTAMLFPLGLFMGMAFPLGMRLASGRTPALTPWLWGINGATSVCASVLAIVIALSASISAAFWTGVACYGLALIAFAWASAAAEGSAAAAAEANR
jgi:SAM-dependent methyltransferase